MGENLLNEHRVFDAGENLPRKLSVCFGHHFHDASECTM
jgi:hypothetical protein